LTFLIKGYGYGDWRLTPLFNDHQF